MNPAQINHFVRYCIDNLQTEVSNWNQKDLTVIVNKILKYSDPYQLDAFATFIIKNIFATDDDQGYYWDEDDCKDQLVGLLQLIASSNNMKIIKKYNENNAYFDGFIGEQTLNMIVWFVKQLMSKDSIKVFSRHRITPSHNPYIDWGPVSYFQYGNENSYVHFVKSEWCSSLDNGNEYEIADKIDEWQTDLTSTTFTKPNQILDPVKLFRYAIEAIDPGENKQSDDDDDDDNVVNGETKTTDEDLMLDGTRTLDFVNMNMSDAMLNMIITWFLQLQSNNTVTYQIKNIPIIYEGENKMLKCFQYTTTNNTVSFVDGDERVQQLYLLHKTLVDVNNYTTETYTKSSDDYVSEDMLVNGFLREWWDSDTVLLDDSDSDSDTMDFSLVSFQPCLLRF